MANIPVECLMKDWMSQVYAFFGPKLRIEEKNGWRSHVFRCQGKGCKTTIHRFLDTKDSWSTGNMHKHVKTCWGLPALEVADSTANADDVCTNIVPGILCDGSITAAFERKGKGKIPYSNCPHTCQGIKAEIVHWVCTYLHPFDIVSDLYFLSIIKTGHLEYCVPSPSTVSWDVQLVFAWMWQRISRLLIISGLLTYAFKTYHAQGTCVTAPVSRKTSFLLYENPMLSCMWRFSDSSLEMPHALCMGCSPYGKPCTLLHKLGSIYTNQFVVGSPK